MLPLSEFHRDKRDAQGRGHRCKPCNVIGAAAWVRNNPEQARRNAKRRTAAYRRRHPKRVQQATKAMRDRGREFVNEQKRGIACADCGGTFPLPAMDWHHRDPDSKKFTIGASYNRTPKALAVEIAKCDLLCANCHRTRTF